MASFKINLLELADCGGVVIQNKKSDLLNKVIMIYKDSSNKIDLQNAKFVKNWLSYWLKDLTRSDLFLAKSYFLERLFDILTKKNMIGKTLKPYYFLEFI